jgi:hypothetical protein
LRVCGEVGGGSECVMNLGKGSLGFSAWVKANEKRGQERAGQLLHWTGSNA